MIKKESEAWDMIADTLEMAGMPLAGHTAPGLCGVIVMAMHDRIISEHCAISMRKRIRRHLPKNAIFLCRAYLAGPRIKWARKFAKEARQEWK
jgi:hypothetical protein